MYSWTQLENELLDLTYEDSELEAISTQDLLATTLFDYDWSGEESVMDNSADRDELSLPGQDQESKAEDARIETRHIAHHALLSAEQEQVIARGLSAAIENLTKHLCRCACYRDQLMDILHANRSLLSGEGQLARLQLDVVVSLHDMVQLHDWLGTQGTSELALQTQAQFEKNITKLDWDRDQVIDLAQHAASQYNLSDAWSRRLHQLIQQYMEARNRLILGNVRLVYHVARRHKNRGLEMDDMVQEGILGLLRAAQKFDAHAGFRFSTYAFWWIKQSIRQAIAKHRSTIRYPSNVNTQITQMYAFLQAYQTRHGHKPNLEEIATATQLTTKKIKDLLSLSNFCISANSPVFDDGIKILQDDLTYPESSLLVEEKIDNDKLSQRLRHALAQLTEREYRVLTMKYGIGHRTMYSLNEIAPQIGVSRERIRQITQEALKKLELLLAEDGSEPI